MASSPAGQGLLIGLQQGGARGGEPPHLFRNGEIADADLAEHGLHVGGETVGEVLGQADSGRPLPFQPVQHGEQMKDSTMKRPSSVSGTSSLW